jgi:DNA-3-methyladenine glycosylase II
MALSAIDSAPRWRSMGSRFRITPQGPFSLEASANFLEGFAPASYEGSTSRDHLHLAFCVEGSWDVTGVCVRQRKAGMVGEAFGAADTAAVRRQVRRILSLDVDATSFTTVGRRDPVVGRLQARYPGLRPVQFWSPYEAACWTVIGQRMRMAQAANVKKRMAAVLGNAVDIHGDVASAFPPPGQLAALESFPGLFRPKVERLRSIGEAALEGKLDATMLRSLEPEVALELLRALPGIGPFSAELILVRGAGEPDHFPRHEGRLHRAVAAAYGLGSEPSIEVLNATAEQWRPFRSWVAVLLRNALEA